MALKSLMCKLETEMIRNTLSNKLNNNNGHAELIMEITIRYVRYG